MTTQKTWVPNIFPALKFKDAPKAIDWLGRAFGFERQFVVAGDGDSVAHAQLRHGAGMIMMGSTGEPDAANPWTTEPFGIYVVVEDIEAHYARALAAGAQIARPLADTPYGSREYSARDCEGHLWSFGTYDPYAEA